MSSAIEVSVVADHDHVVQFYESDDELVRSVCGYIGPALRDGGAVIVVATDAHRRDFERALAAQGLDVVAAVSRGTLLMFDAAQTLAKFMGDGGPDRVAFDEHVGGLVRSARNSGRAVRVYGEMVALLWDQGDVAGAIELEVLWNDLADRVAFSLLCAYPLSTVDGDEFGSALMQVCQLHTSVVAPTTPNHAVVVDTRDFAATAKAVREARLFVRDVLAARPQQTAFITDALLIVSELATNAMMHSGSGFQVSVSAAPHVVRIAVRDASSKRPALRKPDDSVPGGRGLRLVAAMADRWGTDRTNDGKIVWAELDRHDPSSARREAERG
jgi:anti-sigma regulatory factor (Ser/Thr protein kinase)